MRRFACRWLAVSSLVLLAPLGQAETRPQYGGTLRVMLRAAPSSLDPGDTSQPDSLARRTITSLLFDTLVTADPNGTVNGALAEAWEAVRGGQRMQFRLRAGVKFQDGTPLTPEIAASSLRRAHASWNIVAAGDSIFIESGTPEAELLEELALPRSAIVRRDSEDRLSGTGPFQVVDWQSGKELTLAAEDTSWHGRPFIDQININLSMSFRDQMTALELGRADVVEIAPEEINRIPQERFRVSHSAPIRLEALLFTRDTASDQETALRQALRFSVERASMHSVILQGAGQSTAALLPTWMSGYGFVFPAEADLARARQLRNTVQSVPAWTLGYDGSDSLARLLAERIALNARDAGLTLRPSSSPGTDLRLAQFPLSSLDPWVSLTNLVNELGMMAPPTKGHSIEDLYAAEQALLASGRIIPLFHLPASYASGQELRGWAVRGDGSLDLASAWLKSGQP